jgi:DNA-directed RNA polymerase specialized sigma subunit
MMLFEREEGAVFPHDERPIGDQYYAEQEVALLAKELAAHSWLTKRQRDLVTCRIAGAKTIADCADMMGVTSSRASVLDRWTMLRLRRWAALA